MMHNCQKILTVSVLQKGYLYLLFCPQLFTVLLSPLFCQYILHRKQLEYKISIHHFFFFFFFLAVNFDWSIILIRKLFGASRHISGKLGVKLAI